MSGWIGLLGSALGLGYMLLKLFVKSPEEREAENLQKQKDYQAKLDAAMEKAKNEKDPSDLSKLISGK